MRPKRSRPWGLWGVALFLVVLGLSAIGTAIVGFWQGWLEPAWSALSDAQGSIISAIVTLYAASLAATLGPLIFTGQIASMREASESTLIAIDREIQRMTEKLEYIRKIVRQTEEAVEPDGVDPQFDPEKALLRLEGIREDAIALAQKVVEKSNKWSTTKEKTKRKWPGRRPYYSTLYNLDFISEEQRDLFYAISDTRLLKQTDVTPEAVDKAERDLNSLKQLNAKI